MSAWNDARTELLKVLWPQGFSAAQIASRLGGGITRNAVISKRIRMGLPDRAPRRPNGMTKAARERERQRKPKRGHLQYGSPQARLAPEPFRPEPDLVIPEHDRRSLIDLEPGDCRWPIGDPKSPEFSFCNRLQVGTQSRTIRGTLPYCDYHRTRAFNPPAPRRLPSAEPATPQPASVSSEAA